MNVFFFRSGGGVTESVKIATLTRSLFRAYCFSLSEDRKAIAVLRFSLSAENQLISSQPKKKHCFLPQVEQHQNEFPTFKNTKPEIIYWRNRRILPGIQVYSSKQKELTVVFFSFKQLQFR